MDRRRDAPVYIGRVAMATRRDAARAGPAVNVSRNILKCVAKQPQAHHLASWMGDQSGSAVCTLAVVLSVDASRWWEESTDGVPSERHRSYVDACANRPSIHRSSTLKLRFIWGTKSPGISKFGCPMPGWFCPRSDPVCRLRCKYPGGMCRDGRRWIRSREELPFITEVRFQGIWIEAHVVE